MTYFRDIESYNNLFFRTDGVVTSNEGVRANTRQLNQCIVSSYIIVSRGS